MAAKWIKTRQTKYWSYAGTYILVSWRFSAAVNFLANRYDKSWDSTANKQFSLSDQTIKVVHESEARRPRDLLRQPPIASPAARDLLDRYSALSPEFHAAYVDPDRNPAKAKAAGYRPDATILIDSGTRKEAAKSLSEEEITGALIRSLKSGERNVCVLNAAGEHSIDDEGNNGYSFLKQLEERDNYNVKTVNLAAPGARRQQAPGRRPGARRGQRRGSQGLHRPHRRRPAARLLPRRGNRPQEL